MSQGQHIHNADLIHLKQKLTNIKENIQKLYQATQQDRGNEFSSLISMNDLEQIYTHLLSSEFFDNLTSLSTVFNHNHLRLDKEKSNLARTVNIVRDQDGTYQVILETRKKLADGKLNENLLILEGLTKTGTPGYRIDNFPFTKMASLKIEVIDENQLIDIKREVDITQLLNPSALPVLCGSVYHKKNTSKIGLWSEFMPMTLDDYIQMSIDKDQTELPIDVDQLIEQLLINISAVHAKGMVHQDLKPNNIVIKDNKVQLLDLGYGTTVANPDIDCFGTINYSSPEIMIYDLLSNKYQQDDCSSSYRKTIALRLLLSVDKALDNLSDISALTINRTQNPRDFENAILALNNQLSDLKCPHRLVIKDLSTAEFFREIDKLQSYLLKFKETRNQQLLLEYKTPHFSNDIWSLGIIIFELKFGRPVQENDKSLILQDPLLSQMLKPNRDDRITAENALHLFKAQRSSAKKKSLHNVN